MDVWKWEMSSCCRMNIEALYKRLLENKSKAGEGEFILDSGIAAAPHDETLFDYVTFYAKSIENGCIEISGKVHYWHPTDGSWDKSAVIRIFKNIDKCLEWLLDYRLACEESTEKISEKCH